MEILFLYLLVAKRLNRLFMKNLPLLCILLLTSVCSSCTDSKDSALIPELKRAEALMYAHPDSALLILTEMQPPASSDRLQHATWCLFMTQAWDKNYKKHTSDSLITIAYDYFMKQSDPQRRALVANYKGAVCQHLGDTEEAMRYYLEAEKEVEKTNDHQLAYLTYTRLGLIYLYRSLPEYAMPAFQKAYQSAKISGNEAYMASSLSCIARVYSVLKDWDKSVEYYKGAMRVAEEAHNLQSYSSALGELAGVYTKKDDYQLALSYAKKSLYIEEREQLPTEQSFLIIGDIYRLIGQSDSATYYLHKAILSDNIRTVRSAYYTLYLLNKRDANYQKAVEYNDNYWLYVDSIQETDRSKEVLEIQEKYNQEKVLNEKNQLKIERDRVVRSSLIVLILLLCIIVVLVYVYQRKLVRKERKIQQNEEAIQQYMIKMRDNAAMIHRNENRMKELSSLIEESQEVQEQLEEQQAMLVEIQEQNDKLRTENQDFQEKIHHYSTSLKEKRKELDAFKLLSEENQRLHDREKFLCTQLLKRTEVLSVLKTSPKCLDLVTWEAVREAIDYMYDNYSQRLTKQFPLLTEGEIQVCCFIKIHLSNDDMATLLGISPSSVSKRKQRLKEHIIQYLGKQFDTNQPLDLWLLEY